MVGSLKAGGETIWVSVLRQQVRLSGFLAGYEIIWVAFFKVKGDTIWVAALSLQVKLLGCHF